MPAASLHALLDHSLDYAGLFPPASLELEPALHNHAQYVRSPDYWMLGAFILPVAKFEAAEPHLAQFDQKHPLRISALGPKTENVSEFSTALEKTLAAIRNFGTRRPGVVCIPQLEMPLPDEADGELLKAARGALGDLKIHLFWETPADAADRTIALLAEHRQEGAKDEFAFKLRTGGVTAEAFPTPDQIATTLVCAAKHRVPIKFTAGLHHPLRKFHESVGTQMHGFLNVLGAAVLATEHHWDEQQTAEMLEDEDLRSFAFDAVSFAWREWEITTDRIKARRKLVTSFGSCSFDEPREDLRALGLFT